uniref:Uncharacterized protein n=1 Tax=Knipowitschia caucasica TaxID=637954 RepID=A0AAV2LP28_KNICA
MMHPVRKSSPTPCTPHLCRSQSSAARGPNAQTQALEESARPQDQLCPAAYCTKAIVERRTHTAAVLSSSTHCARCVTAASEVEAREEQQCGG